MIENVIGLYSLPLGIALNFQVNGRDVLVPMTIEEPSVVAGASFMAKLARAGGGFTATTTDPLMIGQMQVITSQIWMKPGSSSTSTKQNYSPRQTRSTPCSRNSAAVHVISKSE